MNIELLLKEVLEYKISLNEDYYEFDGRKIPRVTKILQETTDQSKLILWANNIGRFQNKSYTKELNNAANIGTKAHSEIEHYIKNNLEEGIKYFVDETNIPFNGFKLWWNNLISNNNIRVLAIEKTMYNEYYGGTLDFLIEINGKVYLVDFKTSNQITDKYFLQLSAYIILLEREGTKVDGCIILQLGKNKIGYNEYVLFFGNQNHFQFMEECKRCFLSLVYAYYNTHFIKERYNEIFK